MRVTGRLKHWGTNSLVCLPWEEKEKDIMHMTHINPYNVADIIGEAYWATVLQQLTMLVQS